MVEKFEVPKLKYDYNSLEPFIDEQTMKIHHDKHHAGYVAKLNAAIEGLEISSDIKEILSDLDSLPKDSRQAIINNGGGHFNHTLFWEILAKDKQKLSVELSEAINKSFESLDNFKVEFSKAATTRFGSGWAWLVVNENKKLEIMTTQNQDSPVSVGKIPILGLDVWEHAYYLKYQNKRPDYIEAFWNVVNWETVSEKFSEAIN